MPISIKRKAITWGYFLGSTFILIILFGLTQAEFFAYLFLANIVLTFWLVKIGLQLQKAIIPSVTCRNCGTEIDLVDIWKCGCGYALDRPRHAFDKCKECGAQMSYFNCPKCDVSINI